MGEEKTWRFDEEEPRWVSSLRYGLEVHGNVDTTSGFGGYADVNFCFADIIEAELLGVDPPDYYDDGYGDASFDWLLCLKDRDDPVKVHGWHDYTGWGCQSGMSVEDAA